MVMPSIEMGRNHCRDLVAGCAAAGKGKGFHFDQVLFEMLMNLPSEDVEWDIKVQNTENGLGY